MTVKVSYPKSASAFNDLRHRVSLTLDDVAAEAGLTKERVVAFATGELECPEDVTALLIDHLVKIL